MSEIGLDLVYASTRARSAHANRQSYANMNRVRSLAARQPVHRLRCLPLQRVMLAHSSSHEGAEAKLTYIQRAKLFGANALLGTYLSSGARFDRVLDGMQVTDIKSGFVRCELPVTDDKANTYGTLHGGCIAMAIDIVGTMAQLSADPLRPGVSVELNVSYCTAAKLGDSVIIEGRLLKTGKTLAFTEVTFTSAATGKLVATGRHTKAL